MEQDKTSYIWGLLRLTMGLIFLWAFLDKLLGLGFATKPVNAWLTGGSPTTGFLQYAVHGPLVNFYHSLAGVPIVDWLFMLGLLFIGITLTLGIFVRLGSSAAFIMLLLMYISVGIPPVNHPFIDDHIVNMLIMLGLMYSNAGNYLGFGQMWSRTNLAQKYKILR